MAANEAVTLEEEPLIPEDTFAARLILIRRELRLKQAQAAERCGLDDGSWSNWETGVKPRDMAKVIEKICSNLGVDRDWLMWGGPLRSGSFSPALSSVPVSVGQGSLLDDDLNPLEHFRRAELAAV